VDPNKVQELSEQLKISSVTAALLSQRGVTTEVQARKFLHGQLQDLSNPFRLTGMDKAVRRIQLALANQEKIVIYGDYDVDGICSTVILTDCLAALKGKVDYYVPSRFSEGYGINEQAVRRLAQQGYSLLISVDCGITSVEEVKTASMLGMDCVITDHHTPGGELPPAAAVINPRLEPPSELSHLAGAGVAFMLARALCEDKIHQQVYEWLDIVALATVADIVPLQGDNRILVKEGLIKLQRTRRRGLRALLEATGLLDKPLTTWQISFVLAPRLNSAGRLQSAALGIELLLSNDQSRCRYLAQELCRLNDERKAIENNILIKALERIEAEASLVTEPFIVLSGEGWHHGVLGIVASRLCEKYARPVVLIGWEGETGRGSARSDNDIDLYQALNHAREHLLQFGGHKMAAGLTIERGKYQAFKDALQQWGEKHGRASGLKEIEADLEIDLKEINLGLCRELDLLGPFGEGNPYPVLAARGCEMSSLARVGKNREHLKCKIGEQLLEGIAFNRAEWLSLPLRQCRQDVLFEPVINDFRGGINVQLRIKAIKCSYLPDTRAAHSNVVPDFKYVAELAARELKAGHPVLFVYPTCRSMTRHKLAINNYFNSGMVKPLHGQLGTAEQKAVSHALQAGQPFLYLTTETYLKHYNKENDLPAALSCVVLVWPQGQDIIKRDGQDNLRITILPVVKKVRLINRPPNWKPDGKRILVYANRKSSLPGKDSRFPAYVEAGKNDIKERRAARLGFAACRSGALWWDGSTGCLPAAGNISELVLLNVPYGYYELSGAYNELAASEDMPAVMAFNPEDIIFNRSYLNRLYPEPDSVIEVWRYFISLNRNILHLDIDLLCQNLSSHLHRKIAWSEIVPIMKILSDLDLCKMQKQGSIIEIKNIKTEIMPLDINNSLYYLEGLAEKTVYYSFEDELIKSWSGDIYGT
jgi:single-stranded-DNA-specific exonuclease